MIRPDFSKYNGKVILSILAVYFSLNVFIARPVADNLINYQGASLNDSKLIVKQKLGKPTAVAFPHQKIDLLLSNNARINDVEITTTATKKEIESSPRKESDFNEWIYIKSDRTIFLNFDITTEKLTSISCYVFDISHRRSNSCSKNNINILESKENVIKILGPPSSIEQDGQTTVLNYSNLKLSVLANQDGVFNIIVKNF